MREARLWALLCNRFAVGRRPDAHRAQKAPPGAPKPVPVSPEILAEALATINEAEIAEEIREIRTGRGRSFDDFIDELDALVDAIEGSSTI